MWSDTRFAAHAAKTVGVFMHNEQRMRDLLADRTCQKLSDREAQQDLHCLHTLKGKKIDPAVDAPLKGLSHLHKFSNVGIFFERRLMNTFSFNSRYDAASSLRTKYID